MVDLQPTCIEKPRLARDVSFWGMTVTQFLGAFNDNLYKQVVLLLCVDFAAREGRATDVYQPIALGLFAAAFVLLSSFAGFLADKYSKQRIVVLCKVAEVVIVSLAFGALSTQKLVPLLVVLVLMGTHSAFFGPAKFGILPELVRDKDLPQANGIFLMTTFIGIILGVAGAGVLKEWLDAGHLGWLMVVFGGVAGLGLATSLLVRTVPAAEPHLKFTWSALLLNGETARMLWRDRELLRALGFSCTFWFIAGSVMTAINDYGKRQLQIGDKQTSLMVAGISLGIAVGSLLAGGVLNRRLGFRVVTWGLWGLVLTLSLVAATGWSPLAADAQKWVAGVWLMLAGVSAGLFAVPIQAFLQSRPPQDQKGRVIGATNLANWIAILLAAGAYGAINHLLVAVGVPQCTIFLVLGLFLVPLAWWVRLPQTQQSSPQTSGETATPS